MKTQVSRNTSIRFAQVATGLVTLLVALSCSSPRTIVPSDPYTELPGGLVAVLENANRNAAEGEVERALAAYRRILSARPDHLPTHRAYQDLMLAEDRSAEVREEYRLRLQEGGSPLDWVLLGRVEPNETLREFRFRRALDLDPNFAWGHHAMACLLHDKGQISLALKHQAFSTEKLPGHVEGRLELGDLLRELGRYEEAIEQYEAVLELIPDDEYAEECIAGCLLRMGSLDEARSAFEAILARDPDHLESVLGIASVGLVQKKRRLAEEYLGRALELAPDNPDVHFNVALMHDELGKDDAAAIAAYRRYLDLGGDRPLRATLRIRRIEARHENRSANGSGEEGGG